MLFGTDNNVYSARIDSGTAGRLNIGSYGVTNLIRFDDPVHLIRHDELPNVVL